MSKCHQPPLHLAVLNDDYDAINLLKNNPDALIRKNSLGFTAYELAQLLDKAKVVSLLYPSIDPPICVQGPGEEACNYLNRQEFQKYFGVHYIPNIYFDSPELLEEVVNNCPWLLSRTVVGHEHRTLGSSLRRELFHSYVVKSTIQWIGEEKGYGLFAQEAIKKDAFIGQYVGRVRRISRFRQRFNAYCMHLPSRFWSYHYYVIDAEKEGNELRFANHSDRPSMRPMCVVDRLLVHIGLFSTRDIQPGEELTFNYGKDYWRKRKKIV